MLTALDVLADLECKQGSNDTVMSTSVNNQPIKVSIYEKTNTGVMASWSTLDLHVDSSKDCVPVSIKVRDVVTGNTILPTATRQNSG